MISAMASNKDHQRAIHQDARGLKTTQRIPGDGSHIFCHLKNMALDIKQWIIAICKKVFQTAWDLISQTYLKSDKPNEEEKQTVEEQCAHENNLRFCKPMQQENWRISGVTQGELCGPALWQARRYQETLTKQ